MFICRIAFALLLMTAGCSSAGKDQATTTTIVATTSPTPTPAPSLAGGKSTVSKVPSAGQPLEPNGYYFGFIRSIDPSAAPSRMGFDVAEFLGGEEGLNAAIEASDGTREEGLPNDFYIRNRTTAVRAVEVAPNVSITLIRCPGGCESTPVGWPDLVRLLREPEGGEGFYGGPESPFWKTLKDGKAAAIEEQYLP